MENNSKKWKKKLLKYQISHVNNLTNSLSTYGRALDASDTGTGKTYTSVAICLALGLKPLIICPKSVISSWINVLSHFKADYYGVSNYETIQNCKMFSAKTSNIKSDCPFIKRIEVTNVEKEKDMILETKKIKTVKKKSESKSEEMGYTFVWKKIPNDFIVIFDETHRCKNSRTVNSILLYTLAKTTTKILMLSATVSDKPENFAMCGYTLGLYKNIKDCQNWILSVSKNKCDNPMTCVNNVLYPTYASRMRIRDLGKLFPDNQVVAECYDMENAEEIEKQYKLIEVEVERLKNKEENSQCVLARILYARMKIEQLKVPTFIEQATKFLSEDNSVAIFVNFNQTLHTIATELKTTCLIHGKQTLGERNKAIDDFNSDRSNIIICNIRSGGCGISLHDQIGEYPRVSIVSPSWSAQDIIQVLGRVHRANGKTPVRQRIVFCKGTIEEDICKNMKQKIQNIAMLNDGDLLGYNIDGLTDDPEAIGIDPNSNLSEFDKLFLRINVLNTKRDRLLQDLKETDDEIKILTTAIEESTS